MTTATYNISNSGSGAYTIDGVDNSPLNLYRGRSYTFIVNAVGHPFWIQTTTTPYNAANIYNSGISNNGTENGTITFTIPYNAPNTLYYVCQHHGSMNGTINITNDPTLPSFSIFASSITTTNGNNSTFLQKNNYIYTCGPSGITQHDTLTGNNVNFVTFDAQNVYGISGLNVYGISFVMCGDNIYFSAQNASYVVDRLIKIPIITQNGVDVAGTINTNFYTVNTSQPFFSNNIFSDGTNLFGVSSNGYIYKLPIVNGVPGTLIQLPVGATRNTGITGFYYNSLIYYPNSANVLISCDSDGNVVNNSIINLNSSVLSTYGYNSTRGIIVSNNYLYIGTGGLGGTKRITQFDLSGNLVNSDYLPNATQNGASFMVSLNGFVTVPNTNYLYMCDGESKKIYKIETTPSTTILPPITYTSNINITFNNNSIMDCIVRSNSNNLIVQAYDSTDLTTNILASSSDPIVSAMIAKTNYTSVNNNVSTSHIILTNIPALNAVFKSVKYWVIYGNNILSIDYFGERSSLLTYINTYTGGAYFNVNTSIYTVPAIFSIGTYPFAVTRTSITFPTAPVVKTIDYSLGGTVLYSQFVLRQRTTVLVDYFAVTSGTPENTKLHAVYNPKLDYNLSYPYSNSPSVIANSGGFGIGRMNLTSIPLIDTLYSSAAYFTIHSADFLNFRINVNYNGEQPSYNSIPFDVPNCSITATRIAEPIIIRNKFTKIQINYSSIVNGNAVGGVVFEGYYKFLSNNNVVEGFYSSSDLSTNLLIPNTDPFVTGATTLLGKSSSNIASYTGINTTASHAGVFVKDLPFVNALFKSNPYVLLKPSGMVMFDNYGPVNANVLATSYFANKYVMSNGDVYSNKNNSFFSFSNFSFTYTPLETAPTIPKILPIDYTFFKTISQIAYSAKYNGEVVQDSVFVFYLDSSNNYHMCAQYVKTETKNLLVYSDESCDNFPITRDFGNSAGTQSTTSSDTTITETSGEAENATVTTFDVNETGSSTVLETITVVGETRQVNLNALNSNICFSEGSIVTTDQGEVEIQNIDIHYHTIRNNKIIALTETQSIDNYLVKIKKNAFGSVPTQDTEMTGNHMIFNNGFIQAKTLINGTTIEKIPYRGLPLYNILLEQHDIITVNGLITETLNPENPIAKYYTIMEKNPEKKVEMENMWRKRTQEIIHASF